MTEMVKKLFEAMAEAFERMTRPEFDKLLSDNGIEVTDCGKTWVSLPEYVDGTVVADGGYFVYRYIFKYVPAKWRWADIPLEAIAEIDAGLLEVAGGTAIGADEFAIKECLPIVRDLITLIERNKKA